MIDRKEIKFFRDFLNERIEKLIEDFEEKLTEIQSEKEDYERQTRNLKEQIEQLDPRKAQLEIIEIIQDILDRTNFDISLRTKFEKLIEITKNNRDSMDHTRILILMSNFI